MTLRLSKPVLIGGFIVVAVCGTYLPLALDFLVDSVRSPWAHSFRGEPTLTGRWQGDLVLSGAGKRAITLELSHELKGSQHKRVYYQSRGGLDGTAEIIEKDGYKSRYKLWGKANRDGSILNINLEHLNRRASTIPQPVLNSVDGVWHGNTLVLTGTYETHLFDGKSDAWSSDWPSGKVSSTLIHQDYRDGEELKK